MKHHVLKHDPYWHVAGLSAGLLFMLLLAIARFSPELLYELDTLVAAPLHVLQTYDWMLLVVAITTLGDGVAIALVSIGALYLLHVRYIDALRLGVLILATYLSVVSGKVFVARLRPEEIVWIDPLTSFAFPSGHTALATALYGYIAVLAYRRAHTPFGRVLACTLPLLLIVLVALSRVLLNAHFFTDVIGGVLLALFWIAIVFMLPHQSLRR